MALPDYYGLLSLPSPQATTQPPSASDIKLAYHRALLHYHPDKSHAPLSNFPRNPDNTQTPHSPSPPSSRPSSQSPSIDEIRAAYTTLSTPSLKRTYDQSLRLARSAVRSGPGAQEAAETVDLDDMEWDSKGGAWTRRCARCGPGVEGFRVEEEMLEEAVEGRDEGERGDSGRGGSEEPVGEVLVQCAGCSLWIKVVFAVEDG